METTNGSDTMNVSDVLETILPADIFFEIDDEHEILTESKMDKICNNLGLEFKNEKIIHK